MEFEYEFDMSIPLDGGWSFGHGIIGKATVAYNSDGDWWVEEIAVTIDKLVNGQWSSVLYMLDVFKPIEHRRYHLLREILHQFHAGPIQELVDEALPVTYERASHLSAGRTY